jgi:hypothetical protein
VGPRAGLDDTEKGNSGQSETRSPSYRRSKPELHATSNKLTRLQLSCIYIYIYVCVCVRVCVCVCSCVCALARAVY